MVPSVYFNFILAKPHIITREETITKVTIGDFVERRVSLCHTGSRRQLIDDPRL